MEKKRYIKDINGIELELVGQPMVGGQGAVYRTNYSNILVKLLNKDESEYEKFVDEINDVRILDLPMDIKIAKPIELLEKPYVGYYMQLLSGMEPIKNLFLPQKDIKKLLKEKAGILKRITVLMNISEVLAKLYEKNIMYGDISPDNIFISSDFEHNQAWLIDADNMRENSESKRYIHTPMFAAPEVAKGESFNTTYSDVFSFAVLAHYVLTTIHPFEGKLKYCNEEDNEWDDFSSETEYTLDTSKFYDKLKKGEVPWVYDMDDLSNIPVNENGQLLGISIKMTVNQEVYDLFNRTFSEEGRKNPKSRPTMMEWFEGFKEARNQIIFCSNCNQSYYFRNDGQRHICINCGEERGELIKIINTKGKISILQIDSEESLVNLSVRNTKIDYYFENIDKEIIVKIDENKNIIVENNTHNKVTILVEGNKYVLNKDDEKVLGKVEDILGNNREIKIETDDEIKGKEIFVLTRE